MSILTGSVYADEPPITCDATKGLQLLSQNNNALPQIKLILNECDKTAPDDPSVLLLHGLLARKEVQNNHYEEAITWLEKAKASATADNLVPALELAVTYEWAKDPSKAALIYQAILTDQPQNRPALLGQARVFRMQSQFNEASAIYQQLLKDNPNDIDALNALGWINLGDNQKSEAITYFTNVLIIQPNNTEALLGLKKVKEIKPPAPPLPLCNADQGLTLLQHTPLPLAQIQQILSVCDKNTPNATGVLLLHGLLARRQAQQNKQYATAIAWLEKAKASATPDNLAPALELAVTYEWAKKPTKAALIYQAILSSQPQNRPALLGKARVFRMQLQFNEASAIYQQLLKENPKDIEALNGLGWINLANNQKIAATTYFTIALKIQPQNIETFLGLQKVKEIKPSEPPPLPLCDADQGLTLLLHTPLQLAQIQQILSVCDKNTPHATGALLLHGLLARMQAQQNKQYATAIAWLEKAKAAATPDNLTPALELAVTYEWAKEPTKAALIYQAILTNQPQNKPALLGKARVLRTQLQFNKANVIYQQLLKDNPNDIDALNGLGWVNLGNNQKIAATTYFTKALKIQPKNAEALLGLQAVKKPPEPPQPLCSADQGLTLLSQTPLPLAQINQILSVCDKNTPNATEALLLHGLLARIQAQPNKHYDTAIAWLEKARASAAPDNLGPALELAVTYEWAGKPKKAALIYQTILNEHPDNRAALLGKARVLRMQFHIKTAMAIYQQLLNDNPDDVDALNGLGLSQMANYQRKASKQSFEHALRLSPNNQESLIALQNLKKVTKYILNITQGRYTVPPQVSLGTDVYFFNNLNATDGLIVFATHNTKEIGAEFFATPTLLPSNSVLLAFQRNVPYQYGWSVSYDYRQHNNLPVEHRIQGNANLYLMSNLKWFGGARDGFPSPWKNQLYYSGLTLLTPLPVDFTFTGFLGNEQIAGISSAYSFDLSKEYVNHLFYDIGTAYSPTLKNWEVHGRIILPTFTNQALVADYSHYFFNNSTFFNAGWRVYW
jgi:tetratricopeptide (TPR) repeat protein